MSFCMWLFLMFHWFLLIFKYFHRVWLIFNDVHCQSSKTTMVSLCFHAVEKKTTISYESGEALVTKKNIWFHAFEGSHSCHAGAKPHQWLTAPVVENQHVVLRVWALMFKNHFFNANEAFHIFNVVTRDHCHSTKTAWIHTDESVYGIIILRFVVRTLK